VRERLEAEREAAIAQLRALGVSRSIDDQSPRAGTDAVRDEGDAAQASEYQDMSFAVRQRLADRINGLSSALERIEQGLYGRCAVCGEPIEAARLRAAPESETCLGCQEDMERGTSRTVTAA
jgi:RNA polymerase-binding transcription factor DksA